MLNRLRMRHVRCFLAVARAGSVTQAARQINSSQPAVSRTLAEIEEIIGQPLFERTGRGLTPTAAGRKLARHFEIALTQLEMGAAAAQGDGGATRVGFGVLPNVSRTVAVDAVAAFKAAAPGIDVAIYWGTVDELMARLVRGDLEFILGRMLSLEHLRGVTFEHLYAEDIIFAAPPGHPLAERGGPVTLQDLGEELMIVPLPDTIIRREMDKFLLARGISSFPRQIETAAFEFTRSFLRQHPAVACIPRGAVRRELAEGVLVELDLHGEELVSSVGLTFPRDRRPSANAEHLLDHVRAAAQRIPDIPETAYRNRR